MKSIHVLVGSSNPSSKIIVEKLESQFPGIQFETHYEIASLSGGDALIALSYPRIIDSKSRALYSISLVLHGSALPIGRGWSPGNWMLESLDTQFTMSLMMMEDELDSGLIVGQESFELPVWKTWQDFNAKSIEAQVRLLEALLNGELGRHTARRQEGTPTYFTKRTPRDSELDPNKTIAEQWGKLRAADQVRFPAFFRLHGRKFTVTIQDDGASDDN